MEFLANWSHWRALSGSFTPYEVETIGVEVVDDNVDILRTIGFEQRLVAVLESRRLIADTASV